MTDPCFYHWLGSGAESAAAEGETYEQLVRELPDTVEDEGE